MDQLEDYLSGTLGPVARRAIEAHLNTCQTCREEVRGMVDVSQLFGSLRSEEEFEPSLGFYAGIVRKIEQEEATPSFAGLFSLNFAFGRRLVFASLLTLAIAGSYLVSRESAYPGGPSPEAIMAQQNSPSFYEAPAPDNMLVTLTAYEQR